MEIKLKPIRIKLRQRGQTIHLETAHATLALPESAFNFITQGLALETMPHEVDAPAKLKSRFKVMLDAQLCLGHLSAPVSPFLRNYLINKTNPALNLRDFDSLMTQLNQDERILFCGAGPSLFANWEFVEFCLRTGYARVIAGGSAMRAFSNRGLVPDLCLTCDPNPSAASRGDLPDEFQQATLLLAGSGTQPKLLNNWAGPIALTNGMSALTIGTYMEPGKKGISEGGIGVSTFVMNLANRLDGVKELLLLGIDLGSSDGQTIYPESLGFDNTIDAPREHIWACEACALGSLAKAASYKTTNLAMNGRTIPGTRKCCPTEITDPAYAPPPRQKLNPTPGTTKGFMEKLDALHLDLCSIDPTNIATSPLYKPLLEAYHNVYLSRMLYTGEYAKDSMLLKIESLRDLVEQLFPTS